MNSLGASFPTASMWRWCCYHDNDVALMSLPAARACCRRSGCDRWDLGVRGGWGPGWVTVTWVRLFWCEFWSW